MNFTIRSAGMVDIAGFISEHLAVDIPVVVSSLFTLDLLGNTGGATVWYRGGR